MTAKQGPHYIWFKLALVAGSLLGLLLLVESILTYYYVSKRLVIEQLRREAAKHVTFLESYARQTSIRDPVELAGLLDELRQQEVKKIAWLRVMDLRGHMLVQSGDVVGAFTVQQLEPLLRSGEREISAVRATPGGDVLITVLPFRFRLRPGPPGAPGPPGPRVPRGQRSANAGLPMNVAEVALYLDSASGAFGALRRNLIINCSAALALVASMIVLALRFGRYVRGKQLEEQLAIARSVQQELFPPANWSFRELDFAAECVPAWYVGGDFYDVFPAGRGKIAMLLGDVSGKGMPAALLMGLLHGAVRSSSWMGGAGEHQEATRRLYELLCTRTSRERFASLFWAYYDLEEQVLCYINAGHLPPLLVHGDGAGPLEFERLDQGGPVLGLLPSASYRQGQVTMAPGDLVAIYSDGVVEATNSAGEEFGEERLASIIRKCLDLPSSQIRAQVLEDVRVFLGEELPQDDLTLLVARVALPTRAIAAAD